MRVSVALHRKEPKLSGNQRENECAYMNYNRQYAELDADGHCVIDVEFPPMGETFPEWVAQFFSIGICENVPADTGGAIINYAPLYAPIPVQEGIIPKISAVMNVNAERVNAFCEAE